jgi:hypothetical protein
MIFGRRRRPVRGECLTLPRILEFVEGMLEPEGPDERSVREHLDTCPVCREFADEVRRDVEARHLSISMAWRQERISCPHRDLLAAYHHGSLPAEEASYVRFHLDRIGCTFCAANLEDLVASEQAAEPERFRDLRDEILRSTTTFLRRKRSS